MAELEIHITEVSSPKVTTIIVFYLKNNFRLLQNLVLFRMATRIIHPLLEWKELFSGLVLNLSPSTDYTENLVGIRHLISQRELLALLILIIILFYQQLQQMDLCIKSPLIWQNKIRIYTVVNQNDYEGQIKLSSTEIRTFHSQPFTSPSAVLPPSFIHSHLKVE